MAPLLVIGAIISIVGIAGAFELKVSGNSQSVPLDNGFSQPVQIMANSGTPVPTLTPVLAATKNITYYTDAISNASTSQAGMFDKLASMLNWSVKANPFKGKEIPALPETGDLTDTSPATNPNPSIILGPDSTVGNESLNNTKNQTPDVRNNTTTVLAPVPVPTGPSPSVSGREVSGNGTISWIAMDNGFFGIVADDGEQFLPGQIDPVFQVDGLRVSFLGIARPDKPGVHAWGIPIDLIELVRVGSVTETRITSNGTIRYIDLENGFFGIYADNGIKYLPVNLNSSLKTDGLRINFSAYPASIPTINMWGNPVRLVSVTETGEPLDTTITMTGNVTWVDLGSGFYGIIGNDGNLYIPSNLDGQFMKNGFHVNFTAEKTRDNSARSHLWGIPVELLDIREYR
ncbi:MAG TPA: hypothetical protein VMS89_05830 [Methanoregulaceae archaeon]|nr:hypothetical protein [Methanoregulaceae archaeon]